MPTLEELHATYPFPEVIDNTMYDDWKACPHKFFRGRVQGLTIGEEGAPGEPATVRKNIHLHFGGCLAKGLEMTRREWHAGMHELDALAAGANSIANHWDTAGPLPDPRTRTEEAKTLENCILAHAGYFREWPLDDPMQQVAVVSDRPLVEFSGARPIPNTAHPVTGQPIVYGGRFDAILDRMRVLHGLDDKSTGSSVDGEAWPKQWRLRGQFTGYTWLAEPYGFNIQHWLIHGIQVLKTKCNYAEAYEVRPPWMVQRWLWQLVADVQTMLRQYEKFIYEMQQDDISQPPHPFGQRFGHACYDFNTACAFQGLCGEPHPEDFYGNYVIDRWNPLAGRD